MHQQLGEDWRECLDDFEIRLEEGDATVLQGPVVDQFALHGIISRIRDLNLELLSVNPVTRGAGYLE